MIAATLTGPSYFAPSYDESSIELFENLDEAVDALFDRYSSNGSRPCTVRTLDGRTEEAYFPAFGEESKFTCYKIVTNPVTEALSELFREETVGEVLSAVHGGWWDYTVELRRPHGDLLSAIVEKAGL